MKKCIKQYIFTNESGQSLIEAVAALAVLVIVVTALTIAVLLGLRNSSYSKNDNVATLYAQQGLEFMRKLRNTDIVTFRSLNGTYCMDTTISDLNRDGSVPAGGCAAQQVPACQPNVQNNTYIREACIEDKSSQNCDREVTVTVWWSDTLCQTGNGFCRRARLTSCLTTQFPAQF